MPNPVSIPPYSLIDLTAGDIVSNGFRLYRSNFRSYFVIALIATLWLLLPFVGFISLALGVSIFSDRLSPGLGVLIIMALSVFLIIITFQSLVRSCLNMSLISRLAYREFSTTEPSIPQTIAEIRQVLKPRSQRIFATFFVSFCILLVINLMLSMANVPLTAIFTLVFQSWNGEWLALLLANLITFSIYTWISARFFLVELPIVLEDNFSPLESVGRSWTLAEGSALRILMVMTIAFLVTIPLYSIASVPPILGFVAAIPLFSLGSETSQAALLTRFLPGLALGVLLFLVMNMMVMGFWQSIKAVLYYDLRIRREGFDISLRHRQPLNASVTDTVPPSEFSTSGIATQSLTVPLTADISDEAKNLAGKLLEQADCSQLSQAAWWQLRQYLQTRQTLDPAIKAEQSLALARQCREDIGLKKLPGKMTGDTFLEALYWAIVSTDRR